MDLSNAVLKQVSVHLVGNKGTGQAFITSREPLPLEGRDLTVLKDAFTERFAEMQERYKFHHLSSLDYNEVYNYCLQALAEPEQLHAQSVSIAKHLYESSTHPKIKNGELYVCLFENVYVNGVVADAVGLFKTETKSRFLDVQIDEQGANLQVREGVEPGRFDKGCIVVATNAEEGFDVLIADSNKNEDAAYWRETFLSVVPQATEYYQTNQVLSVTRQFISKQVPEEFDMSSTDRIDLLNKSLEYFRGNTAFKKEEFEKNVLGDEGLIQSYRRYEEHYSEQNDIDFPDSFDINTQAVKKQARVFKSVLKLDKNFHIYIHGDKDLIEKGYDATVGKNYYKIYFDEEA